MICLTSRVDEKISVLSIAVLFLNFRFAQFETIYSSVVLFKKINKMILLYFKELNTLHKII